MFARSLMRFAAKVTVKAGAKAKAVGAGKGKVAGFDFASKYNAFQKANYSKMRGTPAQRMKQIGKLWRAKTQKK
eukprot:CAMPEP_0176438830 /NCGR_PEP_ID=MMETSP0127-20121128/19547_1 /TAXON_ID=938130 /ORGANISM="Platyophrya macrostoma, Strain WH" /LENGTH=73 /DNA_ID=CAMNT_0017822915 /DNA_START=56 /DNA_END=277 /DNA_ORIENTATION=+